MNSMRRVWMHEETSINGVMASLAQSLAHLALALSSRLEGRYVVSRTGVSVIRPGPHVQFYPIHRTSFKSSSLVPVYMRSPLLATSMSFHRAGTSKPSRPLPRLLQVRRGGEQAGYGVRRRQWTLLR